MSKFDTIIFFSEKTIGPIKTFIRFSTAIFIYIHTFFNHTSLAHQPTADFQEFTNIQKMYLVYYEYHVHKNKPDSTHSLLQDWKIIL